MVSSDGIVRSPLPDVYPPKVPLYEYITKDFSNYGDRIALVRNVIHMLFRKYDVIMYSTVTRDRY